MKINDYVRYIYENCVYIGKIKFIIEVMGYNETLQLSIDNCMEEMLKEDVIKSSPNIIDLIETGDYVNGKEVDSCQLIGGKELGFFEFDSDIQDMDFIKLKSIDIETIVTKEQMESMKYKV